MAAAALHSGWEPDDTTSRSPFGRDLFSFICDKRGAREAARVVFVLRGEGRICATNVIPRGEVRQLDYAAYNAVLSDFETTIIPAVKADFPITALLNSDELHIENLMPADVFKRLQSFSLCANKATGSSHWCDRDRWLSFLTALYRSEHNLDSESLRRWFVEVEHWSGEVALELVTQFEFAKGLLTYERRRRLGSGGSS